MQQAAAGRQRKHASLQHGQFGVHRLQQPTEIPHCMARGTLAVQLGHLNSDACSGDHSMNDAAWVEWPPARLVWPSWHSPPTSYACSTNRNSMDSNICLQKKRAGRSISMEDGPPNGPYKARKVKHPGAPERHAAPVHVGTNGALLATLYACNASSWQWC